ncbi:carboxymuconolactone decarboxylase family protein [Methylobacterium sp. sgz302541]|uniref:carboxymuconolactone decarboxylase family protein n=1 Tax=unclassified Methylobacterium TaxID=2615210 RepID=UPI003D349A42
MADTATSLKQLNGRLATLGKAAPQVMGAFRTLLQEASRSGTVDAGLKELIAVALAVQKGCGDCIVFHVANARGHGASRAQLVEVLGVCIEMGGGPAAVYAGYALEAFDQPG